MAWFTSSLSVNDALGEHIGELGEKTFDARHVFFVTLDPDAISPCVHIYAVRILDQPKIFIQVSVETRQRTFVVYNQTCRCCLHCMVTVMSSRPDRIFMGHVSMAQG